MECSGSSAISDSCRLFDPAKASAAFGADFLDTDRCRAFVLEQIHQGAARCPECGAELQGKRRETFLAWGRVNCPTCGKWFTATTGTALHKAKLDPRQLVLVAYLLAVGVDLAAIAAAAGVDQETVRVWRLKFQALGRGDA